MRKLERLMFDEFNGLKKDRNRYKFISKYALKKHSRYSARAKLGWITRRMNQTKGKTMITSKDRVIKVSFYYQPTDDVFDADDMKNLLYDFLDGFRVYNLQTKDTTIEQDIKDKK